MALRPTRQDSKGGRGKLIVIGALVAVITLAFVLLRARM
jgi:hypothetical protein